MSKVFNFNKRSDGLQQNIVLSFKYNKIKALKALSLVVRY